ncbi:glycosyltransferase [Variovorax sp. J22P240]|uniref:glycosyltransferase n=1 Tax=Variovorax sp. J22P240 TaxID=3053514 RepID=UPI00257533AC|nr:glycosyltransferase [Variovorax sp. J22P240]MDL9999606.1 glycosyltransferase [Variovorax sp. J22P240]
MRIVIDLQGAQSPANGTRGIGRYTSALTEAMVRSARGHDIVLALNSQFPDSIDQAKDRFGTWVPAENFRVWRSAPFTPSSSPGYTRAQEKLYEAFLASLQPDAVFITSLFEGLGDATVTSIGSFLSLPTAVTLYDLIPLIHQHPYLDNPAVRSWYMRKIGALRRANMWLAISESSRREGIDHLGFDPERCINVSTAADEHFRKLDIPAEREQAVRARYALRKSFVMYTGGIDHRKNIDGLIRAFALLPPELRNGHQLAIVCSARQEDRNALLELARKQGIPDGDIVVTGFVPEQDLVELYNLCALFVFPSWHEGFGLPALEAMRCGAVVIGANTSSVPEVIGLPEALFDPRDDAAIAGLIVQGLTDHGYRSMLVEHGRRQAEKFTWDESARRALDGLELLHKASQSPQSRALGHRRLRPRLAYVSPLPPQRSGIASYSAELLPELAQHYDIDLITDLKKVDDTLLEASFPRRSLDWFRENHSEFDRVLYHFGNSEFHQHMFDLLAEVPGTVVLHDFFLSGVQAHREVHGEQEHCWTEALYVSHGYLAVAERYQVHDIADIVFKYPCNFEVVAHAQGVVVHSQYSVELAKQWFDESLSQGWAQIPHLRVLPPVVHNERAAARGELGLSASDFLVCAFGLLGPTKLNHRLLAAWLASPLATESNCHLVFVGDKDGTVYGTKLEEQIAAAGNPRIKITGWAGTDVFHRYLVAADLAVQLRTQSRGETSGTVLDAMSRGLATVVNANGSMASLPTDSVVMLPDDFSDQQLAHALENLWRNPPERLALGARGRQSIQSLNAPDSCARAYAHAIESFAARASNGRDGLIEAIGASDGLVEEAEAAELARAIAFALPPPLPMRQLFIDVSELIQRDAKSGIQRVVKALLRALLDAPPANYRIEPVYAETGRHGYRYARKFMLGFLGCPVDALQDAAVDFRRDDIFVGLDLQPHLVPEQRTYYRELRHAGVRVEFVVYDLLPILLEKRFAAGAAENHAKWLKVVAENDGALCISQAVADELTSWLIENVPEQQRKDFNVRAFQLGADVDSASPTTGQPKDATRTLESISSLPSFLMVGTVEPRKGQLAALNAFEQLWAKGVQAGLVIVGKQGWMVDDLAARLRHHRELEKRLFWIEDASDEYLEKLYAASTCLLAASEGEGFGLPLIEAAKHGLPILASDLQVFKEVAGTYAYYFEGGNASSLAEGVVAWLARFGRGEHPRSEKMPFLTWRQSAETFKAALIDASI